MSPYAVSMSDGAAQTPLHTIYYGSTQPLNTDTQLRIHYKTHREYHSKQALCSSVLPGLLSENGSACTFGGGDSDADWREVKRWLRHAEL